MAKRTAKIAINEDLWSYTLYSDEDYEAIISDDESEAAETDIDRRTISFKESKFEFSTVMHELFHVFWSYGGVPDDMRAEAHDMEEMAAKLFEKNVLKILSKSFIIYNRLSESSQRVSTRSIKQLCQLLSHLEGKRPSVKTRLPKSS